MEKGFRGERGVEPIAMKIFAGLVLLVMGLGIGYAIYTWAGTGAQQMLSFSVSVSPTSATVSIPASGSYVENVDVSVEAFGSYDKTVTLTATGQQSDITVIFSPDNDMPSFGSKMHITVSSTTSAWNGKITIRATATDDTEKIATFTLTAE